jgi:hypothetical protein
MSSGRLYQQNWLGRISSCPAQERQIVAKLWDDAWQRQRKRLCLPASSNTTLVFSPFGRSVKGYGETSWAIDTRDLSRNGMDRFEDDTAFAKNVVGSLAQSPLRGVQFWFLLMMMRMKVNKVVRITMTPTIVRSRVRSIAIAVMILRRSSRTGDVDAVEETLPTKHRSCCCRVEACFGSDDQDSDSNESGRYRRFHPK